MLPFVGALHAFLAIYFSLPFPIYRFVSVCFGLYFTFSLIHFLARQLR